jgi:hypothetical protein
MDGSGLLCERLDCVRLLCEEVQHEECAAFNLFIKAACGE